MGLIPGTQPRPRVGRAPAVGHPRRRGRGRVLARAARPRAAGRQHGPDLHPSRHRLHRVPGRLRRALPLWQGQLHYPAANTGAWRGRAHLEWSRLRDEAPGKPPRVGITCGKPGLALRCQMGCLYRASFQASMSSECGPMWALNHTMCLNTFNGLVTC